MTVVKTETIDIGVGVVGKDPNSRGSITTTRRPKETTPKVTRARGTKHQTRLSHPRSKTGCLTCRRRKKKCDETKPNCQNCQKNNVFCHGYEEKREWESKAQLLSPIRPIPALPQMIGAVDNSLDQDLLSYFMSDLSTKLNVYYEHTNPFTDLVMPMALRNAGLMHSVLCLASTCLMVCRKELKHELTLRQSHHFGLAIVDLRRHIDISNEDVVGATDCTILQTILHCLETINGGNSTGGYRCHLQATQRLITDYDNSTPAIRDFGRLFVNYHNFANTLTALKPVHDTDCMVAADSPRSPDHSSNRPSTPAGSLSALRGLLDIFSRIRQLRDQIRAFHCAGKSWYSEEDLLHQAFSIDAHLRAWDFRPALDTQQCQASLLYRHCAWVYLFRTVKPSLPSAEMSLGVDEGLTYLTNMIRRDESPNPQQQHWSHGTLLPFTFLLGCASFQPHQRRTVSSCFETLGLQRFGNVTHALAVVKRVWRAMDEDEARATEVAWDWERIMVDMDLDLLIS